MLGDAVKDTLTREVGAYHDVHLEEGHVTIPIPLHDGSRIKKDKSSRGLFDYWHPIALTTLNTLESFV